MRRHHAPIEGLCASLLGDPVRAEDAAQEVFLKAYRSLPGFRLDSTFSTWLYRIASNHCLDLLRRRGREKSESLDALGEKDGEPSDAGLPSVEGEERAVEDRDLVERLLSSLPPDYRLILTLREVQGLSYHEIAEAMDCSLDSVKARLRRAREKLEELGRHLSRRGGV